MRRRVEWRTEGKAVFEEEGGDLDLEQVRQGREKEMNYIVKTFGMFEFGSWQEATSEKQARLRPRRNGSTECRRPTSVVRCRLRFQTTRRVSQGRLVRGDACAGGKESAVFCVSCTGGERGR